MPLKSLCEITKDAEIKNAAPELSHSSTVSFNIGLTSRLRPEFEDLHWIYVPDRSIPFYRVGFYSNISKGTCTPGCSAIYVEVGVPGDEMRTVDIVNELQPRVMTALEQLGWIDRRDVSCVVVHVLRHAYVHHTDSRDHLVNGIVDRLREFQVYPFGRYGLWDYTSMEDSMESASSVVRGVLSTSSSD
jgi:protoporphyrinogen oxidase